MNEKQFARYLRAVRRRLTLPKKMKDRVMDNLRSSINERREAGQTDADILAALGSAKQAASEIFIAGPQIFDWADVIAAGVVLVLGVAGYLLLRRLPPKKV